MKQTRREVLERKLGFLHRFLHDFESYAQLDAAGRRREHYAIERLLQLLCETAADIGLQVLKSQGNGLASSYREVFTTLARDGILAEGLARKLVEACGMRNVLTHLYDDIDLERVITAIEPALELYRSFAAWAAAYVAKESG